MKYIECSTCTTTHRTPEQYRKHAQTGRHKSRQKIKNIWYINRIVCKKGIFFQCVITDVLWDPWYEAEEKEEKIFLCIYPKQKEALSLSFPGRNINRENSFDYFDSELSIYTVYLTFSAA